LIVTLTINPAIDRNFTVDRLVFEDRAYILSQSEAAGGRGILASHVVHTFGGETTAIAISGGESGKCLERYLYGLGFPFELHPIQSEIRTNLTITDRTGLTIKLNEKGPTLNPNDLKGLQKLVLDRLCDTDWLMVCGSIPPGVDPSFYSQLICKASDCGVKVLLDTDGEALLKGIEAHPAVAAPNQQEAERLLGTALITRSQCLDAAKRIRDMGAEGVLLSLGSRGAIGAYGDQIYEAIPPRVDVVCPIGAGDALGAAFVWAMSRHEDFPTALRWGVAAGTASAMLPGVCSASLEQTRKVFSGIEMRG
jgi:1-phosphofructokinase family hexose kinase